MRRRGFLRFLFLFLEGVFMAVTANGKARKTESWVDDPERGAKSEAHERAFEAGAAQAAGRIVVPALVINEVTVTLVGDSELVVHNWSEKARAEMLGKQMGEATAGREPKDPMAEFLGTLYVIQKGKVEGDFRKKSDDGHRAVTIRGGAYGFPAIAFKDAMVTACTSHKGAVTKVQARQTFHIKKPELALIHGVPRMREDMVRVGMGKPDIRFRAGFPEWWVQLTIRYNARVLSASQLLNLLNTAGFGVGVGEWRSEKDGSFGLFHCATAEELKALKAGEKKARK